ncbi:MAG: chromosomal replication initiator DnaA [Paracoccaceae bacterium]|nr:chromosomal replication initiator DnaA [Paracoccaceae bacterium]
MATQLTFDLPVRTALGRDDFFVSAANAAAIARIDAPESWINGKLCVIGPAGAGKTHLASVWAEATGAVCADASDLADLDIAALDRPVALDGADRIAEADEALAFHLHNRLRELSLPLLLTGRAGPTGWSTSLPDLRSRFEATEVVEIGQPDDRLLAAVLVKHFADRQLGVPPRLIDWLLPRMERSFDFARRLAERLDADSLSEGRAVTRPLAQQVLDKMAVDGR